MSASDIRVLLVTVRFASGRFHGEPEWPPAPARLFQATLAACARGGELEEQDQAVFEWWEQLSPPRIAAPPAWRGQEVKFWVPNNDLDAKGGDPGAVSEIRTGKRVRPWLFQPEVPLLYAWELAEGEDDEQIRRLCELVRHVYQLGRGVDMAWAMGDVLSAIEVVEHLAAYPGHIYEPAAGAAAGGGLFSCPHRGSWASLRDRYAHMKSRLARETEGKKVVQVFSQPPKPSFARVAYDATPPRRLFDLRPASGETDSYSVTALQKAAVLTESLRDAASRRLADALPEQEHDVECGLVGRPVEGTKKVSPEHRIRLIPLPSIGHKHADRGIRRMAVEVPPENPLLPEDVFWAFSGLKIETPAGAAAQVTPADDANMLRWYGTRSRARIWQTVTAAALPAQRRRIEPKRIREEAKPASERVEEEAQAKRAVLQALRHANVTSPVAHVIVQREPFAAKGEKAETFARETRFDKERLWHVEIGFRKPTRGPLVVGDGRFLGLGLMAPMSDEYREQALAFQIQRGLVPDASSEDVASALRRAVIARYQRVIGYRNKVPAFICGHETDGSKAKTRHLAFSFDPKSQRLLIIAPPDAGKTAAERRYLQTLSHCMEEFSELRAGRAGSLIVERCALAENDDPLFAPSKRWATRTPYTVNHHRDLGSAEAALRWDLKSACRAAGLPEPSDIRVTRTWASKGKGMSGHVEIEFACAVRGPMLLGRTRYRGGGVFAGVPEIKRDG